MRLRKLKYVPFVVRRLIFRHFPLLRKLTPSRLRTALSAQRTPQAFVFVDWNPSDRNWGDHLNRYLCEYITGRKAVSSREVLKPRGENRYCVLGSTLGMSQMNGAVIWGAGFICSSSVMRGMPSRICAVRGPDSAKLLPPSNRNSRMAYGDPALLMPLVYHPVPQRAYRLGVIPHYADASLCSLLQFRSMPDVLLIDVELPTERFIKELLSCEFIASSSLHGIIAADAYGLPRTWLRLSANVTGDGFKFRDYAKGARLTDHPEKPYEGPLDVDSLIQSCHRYSVDAEVLHRLLDSCPLPAKDEAVASMRARIPRNG